MHTTISEAARKHHYWRGFRAALIVTVPLIVVLVVSCTIVINALIK